MSQYYSNRKYTVTIVDKVDGIIKLQDLNGHTYVLSEERFNEFYVPVKREERKKFKEMSPFEQQELADSYSQAWVTESNKAL